MKHNWEYKRLGDVCKLSAGGDKPKDMSAVCSDDYQIPIYSNGIENDGLYGFCKNAKIMAPAVTISGRGTLGVPFIRTTPFVPIIRLIVAIPNYSISINYLYYWVYNRRFSGNGAAIPQLTVPMIKDELIPVPPMETQEHIVAELDQINDLITKNREMLSQLDALAQSLFYDTFGDPISNPKGFKSSKLGESNEISSAKRVLVQDVVDNGIPFIRGTELAVLSKQNAYDPSIFTMFITPSHYEKVKTITGVPKLHDLLIPSINADGYVWEVNTPDPFYFKDGRVLWIHVNHAAYSSKWLKFALSKVIIEKYANLSRGAVFAELTLVFLRNIDMILPPLALQEDFAAKVEAIEAQKAKVEAEIAELQTLLDARMDYWFND